MKPPRRSGSRPRDLDMVSDRIHSASIHVLRHVRAQDEASGLTGSRLSMLSVVVFAGPHTIGQLAEAEQVSAPTVSRMVSAMEKDGLVGREPDGDDGRVVWVRPTARGTRVLAEARARRIQSLTRVFAGLTPRELEDLWQAAELIERAIEAEQSA